MLQVRSVKSIKRAKLIVESRERDLFNVANLGRETEIHEALKSIFPAPSESRV